MTEFYSGVQKAFVSVDIIVFGFEDNKLKLLIGKRQMDQDVENGHSMEVSSALRKASMKPPDGCSLNSQA